VVAVALDNARLFGRVIHDSLTNLYTRRFYEIRVEEELLKLKRNHGCLSLILFDLDNFKKVNDMFGHLAGDEVLRQFAALMHDNVRRGSTLVSRYGGEEFIIILPETNLEEASRRAEELRSGIKELVIRHRGYLLDTVTVSIGVSAYPNHGKASEALLRAADTALYKAKAEGRDRVVVSAY